MADAGAFDPLFATWARRVRLRLLARHVLGGVAVGLVLAVVPAVVAWRGHEGRLRALCAVGGVAGGLAGLVVARRRRWSDLDVALWLDERLDAHEVITSALDGRGASRDEAAHENEDEASGDAAGDVRASANETRALVRSNAAKALAGAEGHGAKPARGPVRPAVLRPMHALGPAGAVGLALVALAPMPPRPVPPLAPGEVAVQITNVEGLERVAKLGQANARDAAQRERLDKIAKDAEKLRADLQKGIEKREALARVAQIHDQILAERLTLGDGEKRAGLEAALSKLRDTDATKDAARAMGDHDLEKMDREMERIANVRERRDRQEAKHALEEAAAAAKANGAPDVARALEADKKTLEERERRAELLRDLQKALEDSGGASPEERAAAEPLDRKGSDAAAKKMADAMAKALEGLTPEQRKKLADKLRERAKRGGTQGDPQSMKDLADQLSTPEGQKKLEDELKDLADADEQSDEAKRQRDLDDAEQGADGAERQLGGEGSAEPGEPEGGGPGKGKGKVPIPLPGPGQGTGDGDGKGGPGSHHDTGTGSHQGETSALDDGTVGTIRSRAHGPMNRAPGMPGRSTGWTAGKAGGTANARGTGELGTRGPSEIDGVDHSDVPEEYREQVRQYFQP